jgi:type IV pilus assembly protein PilC
MKFKYQAKTREGETQVGFVDAPNRDSAATILGSHDLFILSLESTDVVHWYDRVGGFFSRIRRKDMIVFTRQLATLLEVQIPLTTALKMLTQQTSNPIFKEAIIEMTQDVDSGLSFSQAMERQSDVFPSFYIEMTRAAEVTGNLNEVASFLADYSEKEDALATKASSALIYPAIVLVLFVVVAFVMVAFVFPQLGEVFAQNNVALPWYTQYLLNTGNFLQTWWPAVFVGVIVLGVIVIDYFTTSEGEAVLDDLKLRLPVSKDVYKPIIMARFGDAAALLVHGGIPITQAIEIMGHMVGNKSYEEIFRSVANDVRQGELLSASISKYPFFFPDLVAQMVAIGETTGETEEMFSRLAGIYTRESDAVTNNLVELIQPILMIGMGVMVGLLFASVLIPIYRLTASIQ